MSALSAVSWVLWGSQHAAQLLFVLTGLQTSRGCHGPSAFESALRDRRDRRQSVRQIPRKVSMLDYFQSSFISQRTSGSWDFLPKCTTLVQGRDYGEGVPQNFLVALVWLALHLPEEQETLKWFLAFS